MGTAMPTQDQIREKAIRYRFPIIEGVLIALVLIVAVIFFWQVDVFPNVSSGPFAPAEVASLIALAMALFAWTRLTAQRRERRSRIAAERKSRALAMEDALTGLANRRQFDEALIEACARPPRGARAHGVFMLDLNGFKKVNDVYGHPIGDEVLIEIGARLRKAVREGDLVARLGGDEFAILAPDLSSLDAAAAMAERMVDLIDVPVRTRATDHPVAAAIGIALMPQHGDKSEVLRKADIALYRAKGGSRSAVRFFEDEMDGQVRERDAIERELRTALDADLIGPISSRISISRRGGCRVRGAGALAPPDAG